MREIKFRGKRVDNGEWAYGFFSRINGEPIILSPMDSYKYYRKFFVDVPFKQVIPETVGQYTGLKDKNGKEIYEGDIVKNTTEKLEKVVFNRGCFKTASINHPNANLYLLDTYSEYIEIIGNIWENPELLERR